MHPVAERFRGRPHLSGWVIETGKEHTYGDTRGWRMD